MTAEASRGRGGGRGGGWRRFGVKVVNKSPGRDCRSVTLKNPEKRESREDEEQKGYDVFGYPFPQEKDHPFFLQRERRGRGKEGEKETCASIRECSLRIYELLNLHEGAYRGRKKKKEGEGWLTNPKVKGAGSTFLAVVAWPKKKERLPWPSSAE